MAETAITASPRASRRRLALPPELADGVALGVAIGCVLLTALAHQAGWV